MSIVLDTPEQIGMWVLLSRRHQIQLQIKGIKTPGIVKWVKDNIDTHGLNVRTAKDCVIPIEYAIAQAGGNVDYRLVNVHVLVNRGGMLFDLGIYSDMSEVEAVPQFVRDYKDGNLEIVLTRSAPRPPTKDIYVPA